VRMRLRIGLVVLLSCGVAARAAALAVLENTEEDVSIQGTHCDNPRFCTAVDYGGTGDLVSPIGDPLDANVSAPSPSAGSVFQHSTADVTLNGSGPIIVLFNPTLHSVEASGGATSLVAAYADTPVVMSSIFGVAFTVDRDTPVSLARQLYLTGGPGIATGVGGVDLCTATSCLCVGTADCSVFQFSVANATADFAHPFAYEGILAPGAYELRVVGELVLANDGASTSAQTMGWSVAFRVPEPRSAGLGLLGLLPLALRALSRPSRPRS